MGKTTHDKSRTRIYGIYYAMLKRCNNVNCKGYCDYGGRGIKVCTEWINKTNGFRLFYLWAMNNNYSDELTIERIDNNGNYQPDNCLWVSRKIQNSNKRNNVVIQYNNQTHILSEWAKILNINYHTLVQRHYRNWTNNEILEIPIGKRRIKNETFR
jgi:hypothetical protein